MRTLSFTGNRQSRNDAQQPPGRSAAAGGPARWHKPAWGLATLMIATAAAFATAGTAAASPAASAVPAARAAHGAAAAGTAHTAPALSWPVVSPGAKGERVFTIQYLLNQRIGAGLVADGDFGPKTEAAVKSFQAKFKLPVDGKVGPATWMQLIVTVKNPSKGQAVSAVQHSLRFAYGDTTLVVDGDFGPKTEAAVKSFQAKFKLPVDGVVGPDTWNTMVNHEK